MKITFTDSSKQDAVFNVGDYFISSYGDLRQIVLINNFFHIIDPRKGTKPITKSANSIDDLLTTYTGSNGPIMKVELKEMVIEKTNRFLGGTF